MTSIENEVKIDFIGQRQGENLVKIDLIQNQIDISSSQEDIERYRLELNDLMAKNSALESLKQTLL